MDVGIRFPVKFGGSQLTKFVSTNSSSKGLHCTVFDPLPILQLQVAVANAVTFAFSDKSDSRLVTQNESPSL